jgi:hypothetical protein
MYYVLDKITNVSGLNLSYWGKIADIAIGLPVLWTCDKSCEPVFN